MDRLWAWDRPTLVREVLEDLQRERAIAYTTVMTVMDTLHRKGWLTRDLDGRAYRYQAVHRREEYGAQLMREALDVGGDRTATLLHFIGSIEAEDLTQLRAALRRRNRRP